MSDLQLQAIAAGIIRCRDATIRNDSAGIPKESHACTPQASTPMSTPRQAGILTQAG